VTPGPAQGATSRQGDEFQRPGILQTTIRISTAMASRKARTGLSKAAAAIANMPHAGRLLALLPPADTDPAIGHRGSQQHVCAPHLGGAAHPARSSLARSDRGAIVLRRQMVRRRNQPITSAAPKMTMGTSATAAFATNHDCVTPAERLCMECSRFVRYGMI